MGPELVGVLVSAGVTASVAAVGALTLSAISPRRPSVTALGAPLVMVASLAAGVAAATRSMLVAEDDYRSVIFVLLAGAPVAIIVGLLLARRVRAIERAVADEAAARERDRQVEASRRETIAWLSHDLRTPLTGIRLLAESLQDNPSDAPAKATRIVAEADRMAGMVEDIGELSRLQGALPSSTQEVALDDLVSEAAAAVRPLAEAAGVRLVAGTLTPAVVRVDADRVSRALTNLVRNAVQHTPAGGTVTLATTRDGHPPGMPVADGIAVEVTDECGGLAAEDLGRVFEAGWRGDSARQERGLGLGLAIVAAVAKAHGGWVTVANRGTGRGCTFSFVLPPGCQVAPAHLTDG